MKTGGNVGDVVGALEVHRDDQVLLVTNTGRVIRFWAKEARRVKGRTSRGVRLMRLDKEERIVDLERLAEVEPEADEVAPVVPPDAEAPASIADEPADEGSTDATVPDEDPTRES
jgi:DNA gyrase subunit A